MDPASLTVSIVALIGSAGAVFYTRQQAFASRRAADAAAVQAGIAKQKHDQEQASTKARSRTQAAMVTMSWDTPGALEISITNKSDNAIRDLSIDNVYFEDAPRFRWQVIPTVIGATSTWPVVSPAETVETPIGFFDPVNKVSERQPGQSFVVLYSFTDVHGQRWRSDGTTPERVTINAPPQVS